MKRNPTLKNHSVSRIFVLAAVALSITGCGRQESPNPNLETPQPQEDTSAPGEDPAMIETCTAKDLQYLVGQPETVLETMRFGTVVRIERPGDVITMEYSAERTRILIGEDKRIARVICG